MRTSLNNITLIERRLFKKQAPADALLFEAKTLIDKELHANVSAQLQVYSLVNEYGRKQLKQEIEIVHQQLFTQPEHLSFRQKIARIFFKTDR
ncbi:hypothetical protein SNE25_10780 [Mucilaginibacter sabulilitoris]|uniref:Uncharacterized protein n=1 Tax=Mucilaginibacter sabulilitoris TaxID=1173583 RepID=A0ABZ0TVB1_9SPHI|nr:hypothetical protein [Mucilaginibacter sabulilitoris]WPU96003.1 hypothetical protein SNE25_10780 [Mucilaginibacter sabulilitoris]